MEEARFATEDLLAVPNGPPQNATQDVTATVIRRVAPVRDGHSKGADVVGHHSVGHVHVVTVVLADLRKNINAVS